MPSEAYRASDPRSTNRPGTTRDGEGWAQEDKPNTIRQTKHNQTPKHYQKTIRGGHDFLLIVLSVFMAPSVLISAAGAMPGEARQEA